MIKVLHINAGSGIYGGVSAFCLNIYRNIDRKEIQFDFLTPDKTTYAQYKSEIEMYGGHIYDFGINVRKRFGKLKFCNRLKQFLSDHEYDVIHVNSGVLLFNCLTAKTGRKFSDAKVVAHSHSNGGRSSLKEKISEPIKWVLARNSDCMLACSESAAGYMFPKTLTKKAIIIKNGIKSDLFRYDPVTREKVRKSLDLDDKFVIGHVGRFTPEKNHEFLLNVLCEARHKRNNAVLLFAGEGPLMESVREKANSMELADSVIFLGARNDVQDLYQAMDVFVLPSLFEGFGIVNVEAQAAGLKCITSTAVPEEVNITGNVVRLSLNDPVSLWAKEILEVPAIRTDCSSAVKDSGFDIASSASELARIYKSICKKESD